MIYSSAKPATTPSGADQMMTSFAVALATVLGVWVFMGMVPAHPLIMLVFIVMGALFMGALGLIAAIYAIRFDQMAAITNFVITPLAFLSGTFYSVEALPPVLYAISHVNPVFYLIDGVRYGMIGVSDSDPAFGALVCLGATAVIVALAWQMLRTGYRLKN